jgi:hypothetical protein
MVPLRLVSPTDCLATPMLRRMDDVSLYVALPDASGPSGFTYQIHTRTTHGTKRGQVASPDASGPSGFINTITTNERGGGCVCVCGGGGVRMNANQPAPPFSCVS